MGAVLDAIYSAFILLVAAAGVVYVFWSPGPEHVSGSKVTRAVAIVAVVGFLAALVGGLVVPKFL